MSEWWDNILMKIQKGKLVHADETEINYHPQSGWFEDAPLKGGAVWYAPTGGAVVGSPLQRAL
jgi:hypothetical protein